MQHAKTTPPLRGEQVCECGCNYSFDGGEYGCDNCRGVTALARARVLPPLMAPRPGCETCQGTGRQHVTCGSMAGVIQCIDCFPTVPGEIRPFLEDEPPEGWVGPTVFLAVSVALVIVCLAFGVDDAAAAWWEAIAQ